MNIEVDYLGTIDKFKNLIEKLDRLKGVNGILIFSCDANNFDKTEVDKILKNTSKPILGGVFPAIIYGNKKLNKGTILVGLENKPHINIIKNISNSSTDFENQLLAYQKKLIKIKTMFVFVDGFANRINDFVHSIFINYGLEYNYIGGGAGSLSFVQKPCIYTNQGLLEDCAVIAGVASEIGVGVAHGWSEIGGPYKVTKSDKNVIYELDYKPAFEVYKTVVDKCSDNNICKENFFEIAKAFPFGINMIGNEKIVRDPFAVNNDNSLVCVGEVPQESYIYVLNGNVKSLLNAAKTALDMGKQYFAENNNHKYSLFIDCISRVLFLGNEFQNELEIVNEKNISLFGALTIGEIANRKKDYFEFYNKTAVVGIFDKI